MATPQVEQFNEILELLADELDIPPMLRQEAEDRYYHLAAWIREDNQDRFYTDSEVYPQGSVRLGTIIRPINPEDDYDIDLVYCRMIAKSSTTQKELMISTGEQLLRYIAFLEQIREEVPALQERTRCWRLQYKSKFHLDVLPAIPDDNAAENNVRDLDDAILITDKELRLWQFSNPRGYANWFNEQQTITLKERRRTMAKAADVDIEKIPVSIVRTPLREAIKLLKRHRDIHYQGDPDDKPISIIITTLAAIAYTETYESNLFETVMSISRKMRDSIEVQNGEYWIPNPVNPKENFADKWSKYPARAKNFYEWLAQVEFDFCRILEKPGIPKIAESLTLSFGAEVTEKAISRYGNSLYEQRKSGNLHMTNSTGTLGITGTKQVQEHNFYGTRYKK